MTVETRYMRSDTHTINGLLAYKLLTIQSAASSSVTEQAPDLSTFEWGIRAWKRASDGTETEITLDGGTGTPRAVVSRNAVGAGIQSNTCNVSSMALSSTDAIIVRVYGRFSPGAWSPLRTFITTQLNALSLDAAVWTVYYYTQINWNPIDEVYNYTFFHGTATYNSRIENFSWTPVTPLAKAGLQISKILPLILDD